MEVKRIVNHNHEIKQKMMHLVDEYFQHKEMRDVTYQYIEYHAEGDFSFGNLTIIHHTMFKGSYKEITTVAALVELLVLSYDIFDDLEDKDNKEPPWMKDTEVTMNIVTGLLFSLFIGLQSITLSHKHDIIEKYCKLALVAINGQHVDLVDRINDESEYLEMVKQKSGALTTLACIIGALVAGEDKSIPLIETYATNIGVIAQIRNDLEGVSRLDRKNDLINRKKTAVTLYLLNHPSPDFDIIRGYDELNVTSDGFIKQTRIKELIHNSGVVLYANALINLYKHKTISTIKQLHLPVEYERLLSKYI